MRNRYVVLGLASFIAIALAVPALGGPSNPVASSAASAKVLAKRALRKAKQANRNALAAKSAAAGAQTTADNAQTAAAAAQATADTAQTTANNAQSAAAAANANANTKFDTVTRVEGPASASNNSDKPTVFAVCPGGTQATGGGYVLSGAGNDDGQVNLNTSYIGSWAVVADDRGGNASNWAVNATVQCIGT